MAKFIKYQGQVYQRVDADLRIVKFQKAIENKLIQIAKNIGLNKPDSVVKEITGDSVIFSMQWVCEPNSATENLIHSKSNLLYRNSQNAVLPLAKDFEYKITKQGGRLFRQGKFYCQSFFCSIKELPTHRKTQDSAESSLLAKEVSTQFFNFIGNRIMKYCISKNYASNDKEIKTSARFSFSFPNPNVNITPKPSQELNMLNALKGKLASKYNEIAKKEAPFFGYVIIGNAKLSYDDEGDGMEHIIVSIELKASINQKFD